MNFTSKNYRTALVLLACIILVISGCGGGGGGGTSGPAIATGTFVDGPVDGLAYTSGATTGTTRNGGQFNYEVGQPVVFRVGDIALGTIPANTLKNAPQGIVSPLSMAPEGSDTNTPEVVARVRFLMAVAPPDASGKMTISPAIQAATTQRSINFVTVSDGDLLDAAKALDSSVTQLPTSNAATIHLDQTLQDNHLYNISGTIRFNGSPLADVTVSISGAGVTHSRKTDGNGRYSVTAAANGSYTITPSRTGYIFTPANRTATVAGGNVSDLDFAAVATTYGKVSREDGSGLAGITLVFTATDENGNPTGQSYPVVTDSNGKYSISGLPGGYYRLPERYDLTPSFWYGFTSDYNNFPNIRLNSDAPNELNITAHPPGSGTIPL